MRWLDRGPSNDGQARKIAPFLVLVVIAAGFYPALAGRFALHNDWSFLVHLPPGKYVQIFPETRGLIAMMRPLGAAFINAQAVFVTSLDAMAMSRIVAALLTWILAAAIFRYLLRSQGVAWWLAVGVA